MWILLGLGMAVSTGKLVITTDEGTVVDILIGVVGGVAGGLLLNLFYGAGVAGLYSAVAALLGAIALLGAYHAFFRRRML